MKTFKAGEKVKIAKGNNNHLFAEGTIVTLCDDVTEDTIFFRAVDEHGLYQTLQIDDIEPLTHDDLLPGTLVKVVKGNFTRTYGDEMEGKVGTFLRQNGDIFFIEIEGRYWWMTRDDIEIIKNDEYEDDETDIKETFDELKHAQTFKAGDKVRVITDNPTFGWGKIRKGDEGIVEWDNGEIIRIKFPAQPWYGCAHELELVEDEEKGASQLEARFKIGDIVKGKIGANKYTITDEAMTRAEVIEVNGSKMRIRVLEHARYSEYVGSEYVVEMEYFELVEEPKINTALVARLIESLTDEQKAMLRELLS